MMPTQHLGVTGGSIAQDVPYTNTVASMIETMLVDSSNKMERFLTAQRIQDIAVIFRDRHINPNLDFSQEPAARHSALWGSQDAYSATATWMQVVGPERYMRYVVDVNGHLQLAREATEDLGLQTNKWYHKHLQGLGGAATRPPPRTGAPSAAPAPAPAPTPSRASSSRRQGGVEPRAASPREERVPPPAPAVDFTSQVAQWMALDGNQYRGLIGSFGRYERCREAYLELGDEAAGAQAVPVPEDEPWVQAWVGRLHAAVLDDSDVLENPRVRPSRRKRRRGDDGGGGAPAGEQGTEFADPVAIARVKELKSVEVELLCYDVVRHAWYCQQGRYGIPSWADVRIAGKRTRKLKAGTYPSLEQRLSSCEEALRSSKNCVKQMLMVDFAKRLAYNPDGEVKRKKENKLVNGKRDLENKAGKYAKAAGLVVFQDDRSIVTAATGRTVAPAHPLTSRMKDGAAQGGGREAHGGEGGRAGTTIGATRGRGVVVPPGAPGCYSAAQDGVAGMGHRAARGGGGFGPGSAVPASTQRESDQELGFTSYYPALEEDHNDYQDLY